MAAIAESQLEPEIMIAGYYGFGNLGDEAILAGMLEHLRDVLAHGRFTVISDDPVRTSAEYGVRSIHWKEYDLVNQHIRVSDLVILGGGGFFECHQVYDGDQILLPTDLFSVFIFGVPLLAHLMRKPCMAYAIGVGEFSSDIAASHAGLALEACTLCTVRDEYSLMRLSELGCQSSAVQVTADPAFALAPAPEETVSALLQQEGISLHSPVLGVNVGYWDYGPPSEVWLPHLASALKSFAENHHPSMLFLPFHLNGMPEASRDLPAIMLVINSMREAGIDARLLQGWPTPSLVAGILSRCDLFLGMRYHACLLALRAGVPTVGLSYQPKVTSLLRMVDMDHLAIPLSEATAEPLASALEHAFISSKAIRARLSARIPSYAALAMQNAERAIEVMRDGPGPAKLSPEARGLIERFDRRPQQ